MSIESIERETAERAELVRTIAADLSAIREFYTGDVWHAWCARTLTAGGPDVTKRQGVPLIQDVLRAMEADGLLRSRTVLPSEHRGSTLIRRYYEGIG